MRLIKVKGMQISALLNASTICPHPQPFSLGRRALEFLFPRPLGEGEGEGGFAIHI